MQDQVNFGPAALTRPPGRLQRDRDSMAALLRLPAQTGGTIPAMRVPPPPLGVQALSELRDIGGRQFGGCTAEPRRRDIPVEARPLPSHRTRSGGAGIAARIWATIPGALSYPP